MHDTYYYFHEILDFFRGGLREGFAHINAALGLVIALVAALMLNSWNRIWQMALGATLMHLLAEIMIPVLTNQGRFALPPNLLDISYWRTAAALYLGYLLVIAVLFYLKTSMLPHSRPAKAHH